MENCDCRRVSGPSLLEVTCRQHSDGMRPIVFDHRRAIHKCRSATHQWVSRLSQMMMQKWSKLQHNFAFNGLPWWIPPHDLHF